jgi:putative colanic acid biosynthesis acetyltransferase WcaB
MAGPGQQCRDPRIPVVSPAGGGRPGFHPIRSPPCAPFPSLGWERSAFGATLDSVESLQTPREPVHPAATPLASLKADLAANRGNPRGALAVTGFRLAQLARLRLPRPVAKVIELAYAFTWLAVLGLELPPHVQAGPGLAIFHTSGIVVNPATRLGSRVVLRQNSTLGALEGPSGEHDQAPVIGDDVEIGASVVVIGPVTVGDGARIGAGAVVTKDVPAGAVALGNPATVVEPSG